MYTKKVIIFMKNRLYIDLFYKIYVYIYVYYMSYNYPCIYIVHASTANIIYNTRIMYMQHIEIVLPYSVRRTLYTLLHYRPRPC